MRAVVAEAVPRDTGNLQNSLQRQGVLESLSHSLFSHSTPSLPGSGDEDELSTILVTFNLQRPMLKVLEVQLLIEELEAQLIIEVRIHGKQKD